MGIRYSVRDVARGLCVSTATVRNWVKTGVLRASKNKPYRIRPAAVRLALKNPLVFRYLVKQASK